MRSAIRMEPGMWQRPTGVGVIILGFQGQSFEWRAGKYSG